MQAFGPAFFSARYDRQESDFALDSPGHVFYNARHILSIHLVMTITRLLHNLIPAMLLILAGTV